MAKLFTEYFCECGHFLFNSGDIYDIHNWFGRYRFFVEKTDKMELAVTVNHPNILRCKNCSKRLGSWVFRDYLGQSDLARFVGHFIQKRYVDLVRYSDTGESTFVYSSMRRARPWPRR